MTNDDPIGLGPIIADHYIATTDPVCPDGVMLWPATERAAAIKRILDRHVLSLLAEVTMRRGDQERADAVEAERDQLRAVLGEVLAGFTDSGHPGYSALRTRWTDVERVERWRAIANSR